MDTRSYSVKTGYLIVIAAAIKLLVAPLLELGIDEVYYWTYALRPDWSQFDHPPMVGFLIRLTTLNLWWANEFTFRLGSVLTAAGSTWILFKLGKLIASERAGWFAALLYTASVYTGFIAGFF
ncbi:MAG: glycosyltransferase family 39 protein, partial [Sediminibacterium sp.]